jgi:hypothetical protein
MDSRPEYAYILFLRIFGIVSLLSGCTDEFVSLFSSQGDKTRGFFISVAFQVFFSEYVKGKVQGNRKEGELKGANQVLVDADNLLGKM